MTLGTLNGVIDITSSASVYATSAGAEKSVASSATACNKAPAHELSIGGAKIGDEAHLCSMVRKSGGQTFRFYAVIWRRGAVKAAVFTGGLDGRIAPNQAVSLARLQDKRMK